MLRVPVLPFHYTKDVRSIQLKYLNIFHIRKHAEKIIKLMLPVLLGNNRCFNPCCPRDENQKTLPLRTKVCSCAWSFFRERMCERIILKYFLLIYWVCLLNQKHFLLCWPKTPTLSIGKQNTEEEQKKAMVTGTTARYRRRGTNSQDIPRRPQNRFLKYHFDLFRSFCLSLWSTALPSQTSPWCVQRVPNAHVLEGFFIFANILKLIHS